MYVLPCDVGRNVVILSNLLFFQVKFVNEIICFMRHSHPNFHLEQCHFSFQNLMKVILHWVAVWAFLLRKPEVELRLKELLLI